MVKHAWYWLAVRGTFGFHRTFTSDTSGTTTKRYLLPWAVENDWTNLTRLNCVTFEARQQGYWTDSDCPTLTQPISTIFHCGGSWLEVGVPSVADVFFRCIASRLSGEMYKVPYHNSASTTAHKHPQSQCSTSCFLWTIISNRKQLRFKSNLTLDVELHLYCHGTF